MTLKEEIINLLREDGDFRQEVGQILLNEMVLEVSSDTSYDYSEVVKQLDVKLSVGNNFITDGTSL